MKQNDFIIWYAIILQLITALFIFFSPFPIRIARLGIFYGVFPNAQIGAILQVAAVLLALYGLFAVTHELWKEKLRVLFFLPQFFFLILTAGSSLQYVIEGHYADG